MKQYSEEESIIAGRLQAFKPRPSPDAYQRMADAPWVKTPERKFSRQSYSIPRAARFAALGILIVALAGVFVWMTPPLRSLAQEIWNGFFSRTQSITIVVEPLQNPPPMIEVAPSVAQTFYSLAEAEAAAGRVIRVPQIRPEPFALSGITVNYEVQTVWLIYTAPQRYLNIYQRPIALGWLDDGPVGNHAQVEALEFENAAGVTLRGEYVGGGWLPAPAGDASWTSDTTQKRLRWQDDQFVYEMVMFGSHEVSAEDMIAIAASME